MIKYPIVDVVNKKEKLISITITDGRGDMFDLVMPYVNPSSIFESGFVRVDIGDAVIRRLKLEDAHIMTTRKERKFVISTSINLTQTFHNIKNVETINVVNQDNEEFYQSIQNAIKEIIEKTEKKEKENNKTS